MHLSSVATRGILVIAPAGRCAGRMIIAWAFRPRLSLTPPDCYECFFVGYGGGVFCALTSCALPAAVSPWPPPPGWGMAGYIVGVLSVL